jgi:hypothetical protein
MNILKLPDNEDCSKAFALAIIQVENRELKQRQIRYIKSRVICHLRPGVNTVSEMSRKPSIKIAKDVTECIDHCSSKQSIRGIVHVVRNSSKASFGTFKTSVGDGEQ